MDVFRQRQRLRIAEDLDSLLGRIHDHTAILTMLKVTLERGLGFWIQLPVQVVRKFLNDSAAVQFSSPV